MDDVGVKYDMKIQFWVCVYGLVLNMVDYCVFFIVYMFEWDVMFEWVELFFGIE